MWVKQRLGVDVNRRPTAPGRQIAKRQPVGGPTDQDVVRGGGQFPYRCVTTGREVIDVN